MKIVIAGPLSFPTINELKKFSPSLKENIKNFHPHPWIFNLALGLTSIDNTEVHLISTSSLVKQTSSFVYQNVYFHILKSSHPLLNYITLFTPEIIKILKLIKKIKPDILHGQSRSYESLALILSSKKHVVTNHGDLREHKRSLFPVLCFNDFYNKRFLNISYFVLYQSIVKLMMKNEIIVSSSCKNSGTKRSVKIFNPISEIFFSVKWKNRKNNKILFVGSLTQLKRPHLLLEYLTRNKNATLTIISQFLFVNEYSLLLEDYILNHNLGDRVEIKPFSSPFELANAMSESSVFCLPSSYESFGMVLAESMAIGCPVIGSKTGGIPEIVQHEYSGLLFNSEDKFDLFKCIDRILTNNDLACLLSENGRLWSYRNFHPKNIAEQTFSLYQAIINQK